MGDGDDEPAQAAPRGRTALNAIPFAAVVLASRPPLLTIVGGVIAVLVVRRRSARRPAFDTVPSIDALYAAVQIMGSSGSLEATAEQTLEVVQTITRMEHGSIYRFDPAAKTLVLIAHRGFPEDLVDAVRVRPVDGSTSARRSRPAVRS